MNFCRPKAASLGRVRGDGSPPRPLAMMKAAEEALIIEKLINLAAQNVFEKRAQDVFSTSVG